VQKNSSRSGRLALASKIQMTEKDSQKTHDICGTGDIYYGKGWWKQRRKWIAEGG